MDGVWGVWSNYSGCTASCGTGIQTRTRLCMNETNGGQPCVGSATQTISCNSNISCPSLNLFSFYVMQNICIHSFLNLIVDGQWTTWSQQSPCSATCGTGYVRLINLIKI